MRRTIATACIVSVTVCTTAWVLLTFEVDQERDREACDRREAIVESFDAYTDALVAAFSDPDDSPSERAELERREAAFRDDLASRLAPLEPTDC